jgi:hypothetical protein
MSVNLKSYYLDADNQKKIRNYVMTELSKKYDIQSVLPQMNERFDRITQFISNNVMADSSKSFEQNLERINKITVEQLMLALSSVLTPFEKKNSAAPSFEPNSEEDQSDVNNLYNQMMTEREYSGIAVSNLSTPVARVVNSRTPQFNLPPIQEENTSNAQNTGFMERLELLKHNRGTFMEQRNAMDLATREQNYKQNVLGENAPLVNNDLLNTRTAYNDNFNTDNVGKDLVSREEIRSHRFEEFKNEPSMEYRKIDRQFFFCSKDRLWSGPISNNRIQPALEPYRYRLVLNNNKAQGIYLQNRQRNIESIRVVSVYISITEISSSGPPYIFVYIPELENRVETSLVNRKYVFAILLKDDVIANQIKYINILSTNTYYPTPLAEINNLTFEILNPLGNLYNESKDDLTIKMLGLDDLNNPTAYVITTNKPFRSIKYNMRDVLLIQNFGFSDNSNSSLVSFMNDPNGHTISTPEILITNNKFFDQIYIEIPLSESGQVIMDTMLNEFKAYLQQNGNPTSNVYGALLNLQLQPSVIMEITKLEPKSNEITTSRVTIV